MSNTKCSLKVESTIEDWGKSVYLMWSNITKKCVTAFACPSAIINGRYSFRWFDIQREVVKNKKVTRYDAKTIHHLELSKNFHLRFVSWLRNSIFKMCNYFGLEISIFREKIVVDVWVHHFKVFIDLKFSNIYTYTVYKHWTGLL